MVLTLHPRPLPCNPPMTAQISYPLERANVYSAESFFRVLRLVMVQICDVSRPFLPSDGLPFPSQASSSLDPTFWVTHPTMERLWMFKRLTGTVTDLTWPDEDVSYTDTTTGKTVTESLSLYDETCNGHRGKDVFPFGLASDEGNYGFMARTGIRGDMEAGNTLNNRELLKVLDPRVNALNYIYDTFEWTHCVEDGFDFNDAYNSGKVESKRPTFLVGGKRYPRYAAFEDEMRKTGMPEQA